MYLETKDYQAKVLLSDSFVEKGTSRPCACKTLMGWNHGGCPPRPTVLPNPNLSGPCGSSSVQPQLCAQTSMAGQGPLSDCLDCHYSLPLSRPGCTD